MNPLKLLWSFDGRIGRSAYAGGLLLNLVMMIVAGAVVMYLREHWTPPEPFNLKDGSLVALLLVFALFWWAYFVLTAKRLRDIGVTGWFSLLLLVPGAVLIMTIILLIARGEDSANRYGPGPPSTRAPAPAHHA